MLEILLSVLQRVNINVSGIWTIFNGNINKISEANLCDFKYVF